MRRAVGLKGEVLEGWEWSEKEVHKGLQRGKVAGDEKMIGSNRGWMRVALLGCFLVSFGRL